MVREHELLWDGWLEAFEGPGGNVYLSVEDMDRLGPEQLAQVLERVEAFLSNSNSGSNSGVRS